jgi:hypothetical protein
VDIRFVVIVLKTSYIYQGQDDLFMMTSVYGLLSSILVFPSLCSLDDGSVQKYCRIPGME